jgi:hypothetical protein
MWTIFALAMALAIAAMIWRATRPGLPADKPTGDDLPRQDGADKP